jgi:hypothetical protein
VQHFLDHPRLSEESKRKILWDNAVDFYRFPKGYLPDKFYETTTGEIVSA